MHSPLGLRLRELRVEQGLSLREAATKTHVDRDTIREIELGERRPFGRTLGKLSEGYGVPLRELLELEEPVPLDEAQPGESYGDVPQSLEELLERRGARTRHLMDDRRTLSEKFEQASLDEAIRLAEEVYAEVEAISPDLVRLNADFRDDPKAMLLYSEVVNRRLITLFSLAEKREQKIVPAAPDEPEAVEDSSEAESETKARAEETIQKFREQDLVLAT